MLDRGAIYAAMVGLGMAVTIAISFELVVAIQALVFISAPFAGLIIGCYANNKSLRWRPRWRLFTNAAFAGAVTGLSLALMYVALRLLFIYADSGYRPETMGGQLDCCDGPRVHLPALHRRWPEADLRRGRHHRCCFLRGRRLALAGRDGPDAHGDDAGRGTRRSRLARRSRATARGEIAERIAAIE